MDGTGSALRAARPSPAASDAVRRTKAESAARLVLWTLAIKTRLNEGPALTSELAEAAGVAPGRVYAVFGNQVRNLARAGLIARLSDRVGPSGHINAVWALPAADAPRAETVNPFGGSADRKSAA